MTESFLVLGVYLAMKSCMLLSYTLFLQVDWGQLASFMAVVELLAVLLKKLFTKKE